MTHTLGPRAAQKLQTRQSLLDAALRLTEEHSLGSVSLREITRAAGIVPAGFYRHFPDVESLGVTLVDQSLGGLRTALRAVRAGQTESEEIARRSITALAQEVRAQRAQFRFITRERYGEMSRVRQAIRDHLRLLGEELAADLLTGETPAAATLRDWSDEDIRMLTSMIVDHMISTAAAIVDVAPGDRGSERRVISAASRQLRLVIIGARHWIDAD